MLVNGEIFIKLKNTLILFEIDFCVTLFKELSTDEILYILDYRTNENTIIYGCIKVFLKRLYTDKNYKLVIADLNGILLDGGVADNLNATSCGIKA